MPGIPHETKQFRRGDRVWQYNIPPDIPVTLFSGMRLIITGTVEAAAYRRAYVAWDEHPHFPARKSWHGNLYLNKGEPPNGAL